MGVKFQHPDYTAMADRWQRCIDVCDGQDAVYAAGTKYLPGLLNQTTDEYKKYQQRAPFYNATYRTIVGLLGMIFRKPAKQVLPNTVVDLFQDVTRTGTNFRVFSYEVAEEALKTGRVGVFVDFPEAPVAATMADAATLALRPSMRMYGAMSIINWKTKSQQNKTKLSMVVLKESVAKPVDEFEDKAQDQYRVLDLIPMEINGVMQDVYRVRVIEVQQDPDNAGQEKEVVISTAYPKINGKYLDEIPFQFIGEDDTSWCVDEPPMIDLVDMNIAHYRVTADYEHGCHFTGLPTPYIIGYTRDVNSPEDTFNIGSQAAWVFPNASAKVGFLEFTGQGLGALERNLEKKEQLMAVLGARMLESQQTGHVEAADTVSIRRGGEQSMLANVALSLSIGLLSAIKMFCRFANANPDECKFQLNTDFFPVPMDSLTLTAYVAAWQNGAISYETLFNKLQHADVIDPDQTIEEELAAIDKNPSLLMQQQQQALEMGVAGGPSSAPTTPGNSAKEAGTAGKKSPKMANSPATMAPTQTQLQNGNTGS